VVVMVMAMMVVAGGESRGGKHHQKQGCGENLFHAPNVAWTPGAGKWISLPAPREALGMGLHSNRVPNRRRLNVR